MALVDLLLQESDSFVDELQNERPVCAIIDCHVDCRGTARSLAQRLSRHGSTTHLLDLGPRPHPLGHLRFEDGVDAIWGAGAFDRTTLSQRFPEITTDMLGMAGKDWDVAGAALWRRLHADVLVKEAMAFNDRVARQLTTTPSHEKVHLVVCNPDLEDYQIFNILMATVSEAGRISSDVITLWLLFDRGNTSLVSAQDLFHTFTRTVCRNVRRTSWPAPLAQDGCAPQEPSSHEERATSTPSPRPESHDFVARLNKVLRACAYPELQRMLASERERFRSSGALQYLYLVSLSQLLIQADVKWLFEDASALASVFESRLNTALALYPAISLSLDEIKKEILDLRFDGNLDAMPEAALQALQALQAWAMMAYKIENREIVERAPKFISVWDAYAPRHFTNDERLAFRLVLELLLAGALPEEKCPPGWTEKLLEEVRLWASNVERFVEACPMFLTSVDVDASILKQKTGNDGDFSEFGRAALRIRQKAHTFARLGVTLTNVAEESAERGRYEEALEHLEFARNIARYNDTIAHGREPSFRFNAAVAMASLLRSETTGGILPGDFVARLYEQLELAATVGSRDWRFGQLSDAMLALFFTCSWREFERHLAALTQLAPMPPEPDALGHDRVLLCRTLALAEAAAGQMSRQALPHEVLTHAYENGGRELLQTLTSRKCEGRSVYAELGNVLEALRLRTGEVAALEAAARTHLKSTRHNLLISAIILRAIHFARQNPECACEGLAPLVLEIRLLCLEAWGEGWSSPLRRRQLLSSPLLWDFARACRPMPSDLLAAHLGKAIRILSRIRDAGELSAYASLVFLCSLPLTEIYFACREDDSWRVTTCSRLTPVELVFWRNRTPAFSWASRLASSAEVETRIPARNGWSISGSSIFYSRGGIALEATLSPDIQIQEVAPQFAAGVAPNALLEAVAVAKGSCDLSREWMRREREGREHAQSLASNALLLAEQLHDQKKALEESNARLKQRDEALSRLLSTLSLELRTPLTLSLGVLEALQARHAQGDLARLVAIGVRAQKQLLSVLDDLLDSARIESGQMDLAPRHVELSLIVGQHLAMLSSEAERLGVSLSWTREGNEPACAFADPRHLERIVGNLLSQAIRFSPSGGKVTVATTSGEATCCIEVVDPGHGLSVAEIGNGLALSLVRDLVSLNRGSVEVESSPGAGTRFRIHIPKGHPEKATFQARGTRAASAFASSEPVTIPSEPTVTREELACILVVENSCELRALLHAILSPSFNLFFAESTGRARELLAARDFDCIISDDMTAGSNALELLQKVRGHIRNPTVPFLMITSRNDDETRLAALHAGVSDFLVKPFSSHELALRVKNLLELEKLRQSRHTIHALTSLAELSLSISHEMNNPMQILSLLVEELEEEENSLGTSGRCELLVKFRECLDRMKDRVGALQMLRRFAHDSGNVPSLEEVLQQAQWGRIRPS